MKKNYISILMLFVLLCFTSCTTSTKENNTETDITNETAETTQEQNAEPEKSSVITTEQQETTAEPFVFDVPDDFLECEKYVGVKLSDLGTSADDIQYSGVMTEIGRSSLFEKSGAVYVSLGWDKDTIIGVYIAFGENWTYNSVLSSDEFESFCSNLEQIYGERNILENKTSEFSGNSDYKFALSKNGAVIKWNDELSEQFLNSNPNQKHPRETEPEPAKQSPAIGMTADEVRNSTWGSPSKINTTITQNGTVEQWCYPGNRYIYLTDGIVTGIQK